MSISSTGAIIFEGDYIRDNGVISKVVDIRSWDFNGDAEVVLENGKVLNSSDIQMDDVLCESEVEG